MHINLELKRGKPLIPEDDIEMLFEAISNLEVDKIRSIVKDYDVTKCEHTGGNVLTALFACIHFRLSSCAINKCAENLDKGEYKWSAEERENIGRITEKEIFDRSKNEYPEDSEERFFYYSDQEIGAVLDNYFVTHPADNRFKESVLRYIRDIRLEYQKQLSKAQEIIEIFLNCGVSINAFSSDGFNPLTNVMQENPHLVRFLLEKGADLYANSPPRKFEFSPEPEPIPVIIALIDLVMFKSSFFAQKVFHLFIDEGKLKINKLEVSDFSYFISALNKEIDFYEREAYRFSGKHIRALLNLKEEFVARRHSQGPTSLFWECAKKLASLNKELPIGTPEDLRQPVLEAKSFVSKTAGGAGAF